MTYFLTQFSRLSAILTYCATIHTICLVGGAECMICSQVGALGNANLCQCAFLGLTAPSKVGEILNIKSIVEKFDAAQAKVETLQAPFTLSITRAMLKSPVVSKGTFYLSGSECANFTFSPPSGLVIQIAPKSVISYNSIEKSAETLKIRLAKNPDRKALAMGLRLSYFSDFFKIEASEPKDFPRALLVTLRPRSLSLKKYIEVIQIWVDRETHLPKRVNWVERSGDAWLIELGHLNINNTIPTAVANFTVPAGTDMKSEFNFFKTRKELSQK
jgi:outer membrane lipoprotein-sorting protein